jgi:hypothetical protein
MSQNPQQQTQQQNAPQKGEKAGNELAAQLVALLKQDKSVALAVGEALSSSAEGRQLLGISGRPRQKRRPQSPSTTKNYVALNGEVEHGEGFYPVPPEGIVAKGPRAIEQWKLAWEEGRHINTYAVDEDLAVGAHN